MDSKLLLRTLLEGNMKATLPLIEDMRDAPFTFPTANGGNHPLWVLGHLAYSADEAIQEVMLGLPNTMSDWKSMFGYGSQPSDETDKYPPFDEVLATCLGVHEKVVTLLESMCEEDLDSKSKGCPDEYADEFGTYRQCFLAVANHLLMHRGQVADARRMAGRKPVTA